MSIQLRRAPGRSSFCRSGRYLLELSVNERQALEEQRYDDNTERYDDNTAAVVLDLAGDTVTVVDRHPLTTRR